MTNWRFEPNISRFMVQRPQQLGHTPQPVPIAFQIPLASAVTIEPGQLLGVSVKESGAIPVLLHTSNAQLVFSELPAEDQRINGVYTFLDLPYPYALDMDFCSETGTEE
jgi:hypothetical protein